MATACAQAHGWWECNVQCAQFVQMMCMNNCIQQTSLQREDTLVGMIPILCLENFIFVSTLPTYYKVRIIENFLLMHTQTQCSLQVKHASAPLNSTVGMTDLFCHV